VDIHSARRFITGCLDTIGAVRTGDELIIEAGELVAGGDALAKVDGFPIFAMNVFPGDVARVRLYEVKKGFAKAELVELLTPSPWRRLEPCPVSNECGGCDWTALRLDKQLEAKRRILTESLRRIGKFDPASLPDIQVHPSPLNYRLRSRLHQSPEGAGFYAMRSNRVVPLAKECEVVGVETARLIGNNAVHPDDQQQLWEIDGDVLGGEHELTLGVDRYTYRLSTSAFFQVNRHLLPTMLRLVHGHAARVQRKHTAWDLYSGVGFFTLPIAEQFERVIAVEGSPVATRYARKNVPSNVKVIEAPVERHVLKLHDADFVFLDPPRAGARPEVISSVGERAKEMIAYLSCDPVTFSRDANRLIASGWRLATLDLLDLFPNTHHIETLSSFERAR
jgi:tRNA/tmRNA/rRNA uracil-C5-methylase (TrmA/RlmC/RlmD family)